MRQKKIQLKFFPLKCNFKIFQVKCKFVGAFFFSTDANAVESTKGLESMVSSLLFMSLAVVCEKSNFKQSFIKILNSCIFFFLKTVVYSNVNSQCAKKKISIKNFPTKMQF